MKNLIIIFGLILFSSFIIAGCGQNSNTNKELELKEKELALKEKELALDSIQKTSSSSTIQNIQQLPSPKVPLTRASNVAPNCNDANAPVGNHPLIDLYCGALGKRPIEIYITGVDESSKTAYGYSIVGKNRVNFEGTFTKEEHKAASHQANNIIDAASTTYRLILREPSQANINGVFNLELYISDIGRSGYGTWTSYDGMLYREIKISDRLND